MKGARISHSAGKICCSDLVINLFPGLVTAETLDPGSATGDKRIPARGNMFPLSRQGAGRGTRGSRHGARSGNILVAIFRRYRANWQ